MLRPDSSNRPEVASDELVVENDLSAVRSARRFVRRFAGGRAPEADDTVELLVAELVANAVLHGAPPVTVRIETSRERVHIAVSDASTRLPHPRLPQADSMTGRGLHIVDALSAGWGVVRRPEGGKIVWADVAANPGTARGRVPPGSEAQAG